VTRIDEFAVDSPRFALRPLRLDDNEGISEVVRLAHIIWPEHYLGIITQAQIDYMLACFQSAAAISAQLQQGYEYFLLGCDGVNVGYAAVRVESDRRLFISKLYVVKEMRNQGLGRFTLVHLRQLAQHRQLNTLWLTVNKHNPALQAYLCWGFCKVAEVVTQIGQGYVMDDFRLEMPVEAAPKIPF
jgi:GNAT superfamily N-acetyltransferase